MRLDFLASALLSAILLSAGAQLASAAAPPLDRDRVTELVNGLSKCAGVYEVAARLNEDGGMPANATTWRDTARGARFAAIYLLTLERGASGNSVKFAEFASDVDPLIEVSTTRIMALVNHSDNAAVEAEMKACVGLMDLQRKLVEQMRELINAP